jgi:hypothetical protein
LDADALIVATRLRKKAKELLIEAEALESHYEKDLRPMRDDEFWFSKKYSKRNIPLLPH